MIKLVVFGIVCVLIGYAVCLGSIIVFCKKEGHISIRKGHGFWVNGSTYDSCVLDVRRFEIAVYRPHGFKKVF